MKAARASSVVRCAVVVLTAIGVAASLGRGIFLSDLAIQAEPFRQEALHALGRDDPFDLERAAELRFLDGRFASHPLATYLHILPGSLLLLVAPLQFSSWMRSRHLGVHRWSGRLLVAAAVTAASSGLYFGLFMPFGGRAESVPIAVFGGFLMYALMKAVAAIRRGDVARHREWMIRAFALALGISTVRIVVAVFDLTLTPAGFGARPLFVVSIWTGWVTTLVAAEIWIRYTRSLSLAP